MAAKLLRSSLVSCNRIGSTILNNLNKSPFTATKILYHWDRPLPVIERSVPIVLFIQNHDIPRSMFIRLADCSHPPSEISCNDFMQKILLDPPIAQPAVARHCLAQMILRESEPNLDTFTILVKSYCKDLHLTYHHVYHLVFTQMKAVGEVEPDDSFHQTLVDAVCARFGPVVGYHLLKELRSKWSIDALLPFSCYNLVVRQFCKRKMIEDASTVLELIDLLIYMKQERVFPDEKIVKYLHKGRRGGHGGGGFLKAVRIGGQMFALAIKIKAVSCIVVRK